MKFWASLAFVPSEQYIPLAKAADEVGIHGLLMSDHLLWPQDLQTKYPYSPHADGRPIWEPETPWLDPWVTIGSMIGATTRVEFGTNIYIAPMRNLFSTAKIVGTAQTISGGRVHLGVGAGWMREEFDLSGQDFSTRGKRLNEMIPALRKLWTPGWQEFHGEHINFGPVQMSPPPPKQIPIWCGGHTSAALKRAAKYGDGWIGNAYTEADAEKYVSELQGYLRAEGREGDPFEIIFGIYAWPTPELFEKWEAKGMTGALTAPWITHRKKKDTSEIAAMQAGTDLDEKIESLHNFAHEWGLS
jgi:probable F420-dependent oxidoreductase